MKKTIRNHIDTNTTTRRLAEGLILERRVTENGIDLRVMLQRPLEEYDGLQTAAGSRYQRNRFWPVFQEASWRMTATSATPRYFSTRYCSM